ncbi:MAG: type II secretion system protein [Verrucomicrobia bacterium]|nr:type II secretion system protein [Verrucomicrobiota bacterium]
MNRQRESGYILLEVILAVVLVGLSLGVLMDCLGRCLAAARSIQHYSHAEILMAGIACEFRLDRAKDMLDQEGDFPGHPGYRWQRVFAPTATKGLWEQTITVTWQEHGREASDSIVEYRYLPEKQR